MTLSRRATVSTLIALSALGLAAGCGSAATSAPSSGPAAGPGAPAEPGSPSTPAKPGAPAEPTADPVPAAIPVLSSFAVDKDVAPDFSCVGQSLPVSSAPVAPHEFHLVELGGQDSDRVGGVKVELFYGNDPSTVADVTATSKTKSDGDKKNIGVFEASTPQGFVAFHIPKSEGFVDTTALDFDVRGEGPFLPTAAANGRVDALSILIGGSSYTPAAGAGRIVVRAVDCKGNTLVNAHVALEVDGAVTAIASGSTDPGVRRSYFSDTELPGTSKWTSRSGVVAFLDVPTGKSLRLVVRGKVDGANVATVIAMRKIPVVADGIVTTKLSPFTTK